MDSMVRLLKQNEIFEDIPDEVLEREILPFGQFQTVPKGKHLIMAQEELNVFGIIVEGKINIQYIEDNGNFRIMDILEKGDTFGLDMLFTRTRTAPYHAIAGKSSQVIFFPAAMILRRNMLPDEVYLELLKKILLIISNENVRKEYRLAILSQKGLRDRVMTFLTMQASKRKTNTFSIPFSRNEMAAYLCVNRTSLSHELSVMEQEGIIRFERNTFTLMRRDPGGEGGEQ